MASYIEIGTGAAIGKDSYETGQMAARQAVKSINKYEPTLVMVFCSTAYDPAAVLRGVREITGDAPLVGGTTAGELCGKVNTGTVVVSIIASPYLRVQIGVGQDISKSYRQAVRSAIEITGQAFFGENILSVEPQLDLEYAKKKFALVFMPGVNARYQTFNYDIVDLIRRLSLNAFPIIGACTGDDMKWEATYQFYNDQVLEDTVVLVLAETHLKFGISSSNSYVATDLQASITSVDGYVIKEFYYEPAAEFYAKLLDVEIEELKKNPRHYFEHHPLGLCGEFGNYSVVMCSDITPEKGLLCLRKPFTHATLALMRVDPDSLRRTPEELVAKAVYRGAIKKPSFCLTFLSAQRMQVMGLKEMKNSLYHSRTNLRSQNIDVEFTGFFSYGEAGVNDEGISTYLDCAGVCLVLADELNEASAVAFKNKMLYEELSETAIRNQVLYEELSVVHQMNNLLNSSLDLNFVYNKATEIVVRLFQADGCLLFDYDEQSKNFKLAQLFETKVKLKHLNWKNSASFDALHQGKAMIFHELTKNKAVSKEFVKLTRARSAIVAPMIIKGEKVGVVSVYSRRKQFFNDNDLEFLQTIANQIGTSIVNARLFKQTQLLACTDGLTGLFDHNHFLKDLSKLIAESAEKNLKLSLVMVDLDDFKYCNDRYGHTVGDTILKETAGILKDNVRHDDVIARYGGDEFVIILVNANQQRAYQIAERIRRKISRMSFDDPESDHTFGITASIGIATYPDDAATAKNLIDSADKAMYRVKRQVKNKSQLYFSEFTELETLFSDQEKAYFDTIKILVQLLDSKDRYTWEHSRQVAYYAVQLAEQMGLAEDEKYWLRLTGYLHDIGKIHVSNEILNNKGSLNNDEISLIRLHPVVGANLLAPIQEFKKIIPIIYHHHEWYDGSGYPARLRGEAIPIGARLLTVVDGFDAMTSDRPYRKAQAVQWAVEELQRNKGTQYDPAVVDAFIKVVKREYISKPQGQRRRTDPGYKKGKNAQPASVLMNKK